MQLRSLLLHALIALLLITSTTAAKITGAVHDDKDTSGAQDPGGNEPGVEGGNVVVADNNAGSTIDTVTADAPRKGMADVPSRRKAQIIVTNDIDETALPVKITGTVYNDKDASGNQDSGELGIEGVSVIVSDAATGTTIDTVTTDAAGMWMAYVSNGKKASIDVDDTTLPSNIPGMWLQTDGFDPTVKRAPGSTRDGYCLWNPTTPEDCCAFSAKKVRIQRFVNGSNERLIGLAIIDQLWGTRPYLFPVGDRVQVAGNQGSWWYRNKLAVPITVGFTGVKGSDPWYYVNTPEIEPKAWYQSKCGRYSVIIFLDLDTGNVTTRLWGNCASNLKGVTSFLCWEMIVST